MGSAEVVGITGAYLNKPLRPGGTSELVVKAAVLPGWHINSDQPHDSDFIPTRLKVAAPKSISVGQVEYPFPEEVALQFSAGEKLSVFTGALEFDAPLKAGPNFAPSAGNLTTITIDYQACNNNECLPPSSVSITVDLATLGVRPPAASPGPKTGAGNIPGAGLAHLFSTHGYLLGFLAVLLGGLALNLTPCVYPLIGVTVAYFGNQEGGPRRIIFLAVVYVLGIAAMFSGLGLAASLSGGLFGAALQNPWVLSGIAAMLIVLAASSFGWFTLNPPQWMARWAGTARPGYAGAFLMGLGMGVVAAPCIGPIVLGLLLMVERSQSPVLGFALFFTLAVGLGVPYVALAIAAGSIRRLPRSGDWLRWIDQLFGFVLIGLAIYFLAPVVPGGLMSRLLPYYAAASGIFLGFISPAGRSWRPFLVIRSALGVVSVAALIYLLVSPGAPTPLKFQPFDASRLSTAEQEHKPVMLDFSADWCIPCREMQHSTFVDPAVVKEAQRFVRMRADLTSDDHTNAAITKRFNVKGVPTVVLIDSKGMVTRQTVGYVGPKQMLDDLRRVD
jgi:thioredoxin:protein disulfide reductase